MASSVVAQQRRVWNTGDTASFPFRVADSAGNPIPLLAGSPTYAIISPSGLQVETGPATPTAPPGSFSVTWTVPLQAELSTPNTPWRVEIQITTARRHEKTLEFSFDVINRTADTTEKRDIIEAHLESQPYRAQWRGDAEPDTLTLECYYTASPGTGADPITVPLDKSQLRRTVSGTDVVYYYDIPAAAFTNGVRSMFKNQFTLLWVSRDTPTAETMTQYQQVRVMKRQGFELVTGVRMIVDRFQHKLGTAFYISDGDICESLDKGLGLLNGWYPVTNPPYTDSMVPESLKTFWVMLSSWWMLSSQHMLAGTLAFNFCVDEDTWVRTDTGCYRIRHLNHGNLIQDSIAAALTPEISAAVVHEGFFTDLCTELARVVDLDTADTADTALVQVLAKEIRHTVQVPPELQQHIFPHRRLDTPLGIQTPSMLWDLGSRYVHRLRTQHGYEITGTHNHPVLTVTPDLEFVQHHLADIGPGQLVALSPEAEPDRDYTVDLGFLQTLLLPIVPEGLTLPSKVTPDLCTVLGYRAATEVSASGGDQHLMSEAYTCAYSICFGVAPLDANPEQHKAINRWLRGAGDVDLVHNHDGIPWSVMAASKPCAAAFLRALFEATGTYYSGEPTFRVELSREVGYGVGFACASRRQQLDLQQLLLRFGIVSQADPAANGQLCVLVAGEDLNTYATRIGFLTRGDSYQVTPKAPVPLPGLITAYLHRHIPTTMLGACDLLDTYDGLQRYLDLLGADLAKADPGLHSKVRQLLRHRWLWTEVVSVDAAGISRVYDPTLPITHAPGSAFPEPLTNLFFTNGLVTHNSGQSISLDQDITGTLDSAISRLVDWLNTHLTAAKLMIYRQRAQVGSVAVRPYRIVGPNTRTYRVESSPTGSFGGPQNLQSVAQILGILS